MKTKQEDNDNVELSNDEISEKINENKTTAKEENLQGNSEPSIKENTPTIEEEIQKLQITIQEQKDKYLRLMAEFENFKKRTAKERIELIQTAGKDIIVSLLDVLDDCERAEKQLLENTDIEKQKEGVFLVFNKLRIALCNRGLKNMESKHCDFDVEKHEAITEIPVTEEKLKNKVIEEVTKGYYLHDKLIRHAKVVVGK